MLSATLGISDEDDYVFIDCKHQQNPGIEKIFFQIEQLLNNNLHQEALDCLKAFISNTNESSYKQYQQILYYKGLIYTKINPLLAEQNFLSIIRKIGFEPHRHMELNLFTLSKCYANLAVLYFDVRKNYALARKYFLESYKINKYIVYDPKYQYVFKQSLLLSTIYDYHTADSDDNVQLASKLDPQCCFVSYVKAFIQIRDNPNSHVQARTFLEQAEIFQNQTVKLDHQSFAEIGKIYLAFSKCRNISQDILISDLKNAQQHFSEALILYKNSQNDVPLSSESIEQIEVYNAFLKQILFNLGVQHKEKDPKISLEYLYMALYDYGNDSTDVDILIQIIYLNKKSHNNNKLISAAEKLLTITDDLEYKAAAYGAKGWAFLKIGYYMLAANNFSFAKSCMHSNDAALEKIIDFNIESLISLIEKTTISQQQVIDYLNTLLNLKYEKTTISEQPAYDDCLFIINLIFLLNKQREQSQQYQIYNLDNIDLRLIELERCKTVLTILADPAIISMPLPYDEYEKIMKEYKDHNLMDGASQLGSSHDNPQQNQAILAGLRLCL